MKRMLVHVHLSEDIIGELMKLLAYLELWTTQTYVDEPELQKIKELFDKEGEFVVLLVMLTSVLGGLDGLVYS